jgi:hypothetical protein
MSGWHNASRMSAVDLLIEMAHKAIDGGTAMTFQELHRIGYGLSQPVAIRPLRKFVAILGQIGAEILREWIPVSSRTSCPKYDNFQLVLRRHRRSEATGLAKHRQAALLA